MGPRAPYISTAKDGWTYRFCDRSLFEKDHQYTYAKRMTTEIVRVRYVQRSKINNRQTD